MTDFRQSNCRIITITNWKQYQGNDRPSDRPVTDKRQTCDRPVTVDKEYKELKEREEGKEVKNKYGEYQHVRLTEKERDRLFNDYGEAETLEAIKYLDEYIEMKGYKAKSHYLCIRKWVFDAVKRDRPQNKPQSLAEKWGLSDDV